VSRSAFGRAVAAVVACCAVILAGASISTAAAAEPAFPRTLGLYLDHGGLPSASALARYDVIVVDNEWANRDPGTLRAAKALNPDLKILAYVNLVDRPLSLGSQSGWANRWSLWGYVSSGTLGTFPEAWIAKTASGGVVSEWAGTWMTNLSDTAPVVNGQRFYQYAANWTVDHVWASGVFDGIFLDVWGDRIWNPAAQSWDVDRNGSNDSGAALYGPDSPWERGITAAEQIMRSRMGPGAIIVANNTRTFRGNRIDGRTWESFADPGKGRSFAGDMPNYVAGVTDPGHAQPGVQLTLDKGFSATPGPVDQQRARYFMTASLLSNGYWGGSVGDYEGFGWYEEMDGAGLGRGYLGQPIAANPTWAQISATYSAAAGVGRYANGLYRRDFTNGIAITNPSGSTQTVALGGTFRRLAGSSSVNTGATVDTVTIPAQDGIILMRPNAIPAPPPAAPALTIAVSPASATVLAGATRAFTATVSDGSAVTWAVNGVPGGTSASGRITAAGLYTAPASVPAGGSVRVRATSASGASAEVVVTIRAAAAAPAPGSSPAPAPEGKSRVPGGSSPAPAPDPAPVAPSTRPLVADGFESGPLAGAGSPWRSVTADRGAGVALQSAVRRSGARAVRFVDASARARRAFLRADVRPAARTRVSAQVLVSSLRLRPRGRVALVALGARRAGGARQMAGIVRQGAGAPRYAVWSVDRAGRTTRTILGARVRRGAWTRLAMTVLWSKGSARTILSAGGRAIASPVSDVRGSSPARLDLGLVAANSPAHRAVLYMDDVR
jgi:hypothetical protein